MNFNFKFPFDQNINIQNLLTLMAVYSQKLKSKTIPNTANLSENKRSNRIAKIINNPITFPTRYPESSCNVYVVIPKWTSLFIGGETSKRRQVGPRLFEKLGDAKLSTTSDSRRRGPEKPRWYTALFIFFWSFPFVYIWVWMGIGRIGSTCAGKCGFRVYSNRAMDVLNVVMIFFMYTDSIFCYVKFEVSWCGSR